MDLLLRLLGLVVVVVAAVQADAIDATRTPNAFGSDVVNAVVDSLRSRCIFSEDRMFLRRLAYVETKDGTDTNTYRPGYDGGIWQVDQSAFSVTVNCSLYIQSTCSTIKQEFGIDWPSVGWSDLRKPLYSGIAATLFILLELRGNASRMPADLAGQETFWIHNYHQGQTQQKNFPQLAAEATTFVCKNPMDIVFIVDSSGSITDTDFLLGLNFVALVVDALNVPQDRVAVLTFASLPHVQFRFDTYNTKNQLAAAIRSIVKISGGTATDLALDTARTVLFPQARPNVNHVAVLITDGQSASIVATIAAANLLKKSGVTVFAIGIGGYYLPELKGVASDPNCSYVYTLDSFSEMDSILHEIQKRTCEASVTLTTGTDSYLGTGSNDGDGSTFVVPPLNHTGLVVNVTCGILDVYISYTNPNPNPALYAEKLTATEGHPVYLQFESSHDGRPAYITVVGTKLPSSSLGLGDCIDFSYSVTVVENLVVVRCCDGLECRECSATDIRQEPQLRKILCGNENVVNPNPCTQLALNSGKFIHPYPYDPAKFIRCDYMGRTYVTLCPNRQTFNPTTLACGYHTPGSSYSTLLPSGYPNPCTPYQIQSHHFFFQYTPDHKQFIHCDLWGNAWLQSCPSLEVWDQNLLTCVLERPIVVVTTKGPVTIVNPCTPYNMAHGLLFHPYPCDHTRFIHCDVTGNYYVQSCPSGLFYNPEAFVCVPGDPQSSGGCEQ